MTDYIVKISDDALGDSFAYGFFRKGMLAQWSSRQSATLYTHHEALELAAMARSWGHRAKAMKVRPASEAHKEGRE